MSRAAKKNWYTYWNEKAKLIYKRLRRLKKINSKITFSAFNKNKKQHLKQKNWVAKINEIKTKKEKLKQNNLSCKKNRVANQNNKRNKKFRDWSRKKTRCRKNFFA